jgi:hypothetical protein
MIGLSTPIFDIDGDFIFYANNLIIDDLTNTTVERRINKVKTLDGGVFIDDSGYTAGDIDIVISVRNPDEILFINLRNLFLYHSFVTIITAEGNYSCVPYTIKLVNGNAVMVFSTKEEV